MDVANLDSTVDPVWRHWLVFADTEEGTESKEKTSRQFRDLATEAGAHLPLALRQSTFGENEPHHYADRWLTLLFRYLKLNPMQCRTAEGEILPSGLVSHIPFDKCADLIDSELLPQIQCQHDQETPLATGQTGHETGQAEEKTKTPPFPATLGFREFFNRVRQSEAEGDEPNKAEISREIGANHELAPTTLADTYRRYIRRLKSSGQ